MYNLKAPNFQILIGGTDISEAVVGFSFRHPLAEPYTPLVWTGQIELVPIRSGLARSFFDDEANPSRWLSGLQPIDVYFNGTLWQRFRIKPSGYRYNQDNGQAEVEITDIIGILDSYQPSADAPEFKTGFDNQWNNLAVALIQKQVSLMGATVSVDTPPYGIGGIFRVPRTVKGSYIKEAQKLAGERGYWMWSDKEVIKWAKYPEGNPTAIVWAKPRKALLNYSRQQGLDPVKASLTVSSNHEDIFDCQDVYPKYIYTFASGQIINTPSGVVGRYSGILSSITKLDRKITNGCIYNFTKYTTGNPMLTLFGGTLDEFGRYIGEPPEVKGAKTIIPSFGGGGIPRNYERKENGSSSTSYFSFEWTGFRPILQESDITTYENVPVDSQNPSKILKRVITRSEPFAKFPDGLQYFGQGYWFNLNAYLGVTERTTTTYTYRAITRDDIIVIAGQQLYEVASIEEVKEQIYFYKKEEGTSISGKRIVVTPKLVPQESSLTSYEKICQGLWRETKTSNVNKGQSTTSPGYLYGVNKTQVEVTSIPEITYRPAPYPVYQKPLLATASTGYAGVSPFVQNRDFKNADTLTTQAECEAYAKFLGRINWQRYYSRELASGFQTTLGYEPFQGVYAGNGCYIRDRFGISLNYENKAWQFVEDCIGNKVGAIAEIQPDPIPFPPVLSDTLNIGAIPNQNIFIGIPFSIELSAAGGIAPYVFSSSTLPTGLSISGSTLSGTPTAIATTSTTITVTDALSQTASITFTINVQAIPIPASITSVTYTLASTLYQIEMGASLLGGLPFPKEAPAIYAIEIGFRKVTPKIATIETQAPQPSADGTGEIYDTLPWRYITANYWRSITSDQWRNTL